MKKCASVYSRKGALYVRASSQTTAGVWIDSDSVEKLDSGVAPHQKGEAVLRALTESVQGIAHPTSWRNNDDDPLWGPGGFAGVRSWRAFLNGCSCVAVTLDVDSLRFDAWKNEGPKNGFTPLPHKGIRLPSDASPPEIGVALDRALALCEPPPSR